MTDFLGNPSVAKFYKDVPQQHLQAYREFRDTHTFKRVTLDGVAWAYYDIGEGTESRLMLTGALGVPYFEWHHLLHFAQTHRIIAPCYPPVDTMDALCDGIAGILQHEGIRRAHVQGGSYGGFVAQVFARRFPEMTASLILSHTQPPYPDDAGSAKISRTLAWMRWLPTGMLRWLMGRSLGKLMPPKTPDNALMLAIFDELLHVHLTKAGVLSILARTVDFEAKRFTPDDLEDWPGRILLMMTDDDRTTAGDVQRDLRALYSQAQVHLFHGTGHATSWAQAEAYRTVIDDFIQHDTDTRE